MGSRLDSIDAIMNSSSNIIDLNFIISPKNYLEN